MKSALPILLLSVLLLSSCSQRTVLSETQSYSLGKEWSKKAGDQDEIHQKYTSSFEIKDGRAVATGSKKSPFTKTDVKGNEIAGESYFNGDKRSVEKKKLFGSDKMFRIKPFRGSDPALESGSISPYATADAGLSETYSTEGWNQSDQTFKTSANRNADKGFKFFGNNREARMASDADHVQAQTTMDQYGNQMSVDDVRQMLHPES